MVLELTLPVCAIIFSLLLCFIYFRKKRLKLFENNMYSIMLISTLIDSILVVIEKSLVIGKELKNINNTLTQTISFLNKIDACILIIVTTCIFLYILIVTLNFTKNKLKKYIIATIIVNILSFIIIFLLDINLIESNGIISIYGKALIPTYIICGIYILLSILVTLFNFRKINKKHLPLLVTIVIFTFLMFMFIYNPFITVISISLTFINFFMYFTIENPDLKVINQLLRNKELVEEQMEDKSSFLFEMSQSIKGPSKNILELTKVYNKLNKEIDKKDLIRTIGNNANELIFRTNNILDVSSMDISKIKIIEEEYSLYTLINEIKGLTESRIKNKNIILNFKINKNIPNILSGDSVRLKQVIMSLLINSIENTSKGEIGVSIDAITRYDVIRLIIKIEDTGKGLSLDEINNILSNVKDLGIEDIKKLDKLDVDMPVAIKIIKLLNGNLNIRSIQNKGTIVNAVIDQKYKLDKVSEEEKNLERYQSDVYGRKRVLIVDDDRQELYRIKSILSKYNLDVNDSMIGNECVDRVRTGELYNLIIIDDELSKDSALNILKKLSEIKCKIPIVVMLNKNKEHLKENYINDGFKDCILKDNLSENLNDIINKYL